MAEVNANSLPAKTDLGTNDSAIVVDQTTNAGALVDLDVLADKVLDRITSKTFANQVGGSSAATLLAQLSTLNSNMKAVEVTPVWNENVTFTTNLSHVLRIGEITLVSLSFVLAEEVAGNTVLATGLPTARNSWYAPMSSTSSFNAWTPVYITSGTGTLTTNNTLAAGWHWCNLVYCNYPVTTST